MLLNSDKAWIFGINSSKHAFTMEFGSTSVEHKLLVIGEVLLYSNHWEISSLSYVCPSCATTGSLKTFLERGHLKISSNFVLISAINFFKSSFNLKQNLEYGKCPFGVLSLLNNNRIFLKFHYRILEPKSQEKRKNYWVLNLVDPLFFHLNNNSKVFVIFNFGYWYLLLYSCFQF